MASPGTSGQLGSVEIWLAEWVEDQDEYQRRLIPVAPASRTIVGSDDQVAPETTIAEWHINDWSGGLGTVKWTNGTFRTSTGLSITSDGDRIVSGHGFGSATDTRDYGALTLVDGRPVAFSEYDWVEYDGSSWNIVGNIDMVDRPMSVAAGDDLDTVFWSSDGSDSSIIYRIDMDTFSPLTVVIPVEFINDLPTGPGYVALTTWMSDVYFVRQNDLYIILDQTAASGTATNWAKKSDVVGAQTKGYFNTFSGDEKWNRITTTDIGLVWWVRGTNGTTWFWEYNVASDTSTIVGELPERHALPLDIYFQGGWFYCVYRRAFDSATNGTAFLYAFQRVANGGLSSVVRLADDDLDIANSSYGASISGFYGDQIIVMEGAGPWFYDVTSGGLFRNGSGMIDPAGSMVYGSKLVGLGLNTGTSLHQRKVMDLDEFGVSGQLDTGWYDFAYRGISKVLLDVTLECEEPIPGNGQISVEYRSDVDDTFAALSPSMLTGETVRRWVISDNTSTVAGRRFEFRIVLTKPSDLTLTQKVVSLTARAAGAEYRIEWVLTLDVSTQPEQDAWKIIKDLRDMAMARDVVQLTDPWQQRDSDGAETFDVIVEDVYLPQEQDDAFLVANVLLRSVETFTEAQ